MPRFKYFQNGVWHDVGGLVSGGSMYHNPNAGGLVAAGGSLAFDFGQAPDGAPNGGGSKLFYFVGGDYTDAYAIRTGIYTVKVQITPGVYDVVPGFLVNTDNRYTEEHNKYARTYTEMGFSHDDVLGTGFVPLDIPGAENFISGGHTETYKIFANDFIQAGMQNLGDYPHIFSAQIEISVVYIDD